jgi:hypothetical protein
MEKQIGLLIMKDENDILHEYLTHATKYFDPIYVLDGTEDSEEGREICSQFPEVVFYEKDKNVIQGKSTCAIRGFLWEKIKAEVVGKKWVCTLHPDEFFESDPLPMLDHVDATHPSAGSIIIRSLHFFLHTSQKETWNFQKGDLIEPLQKWHMAPGMSEYRFFKFNKDFVYTDQHMQPIPMNAMNSSVTVNNFRIKQFSFRNPEQAMKRVNSRIDSEWQPNDYIVLKESGDVFVDTLKWTVEMRAKYPVQGNVCWYNHEWAYVDKLN